jgi:plasmid stability protein
MIQLRNLPNALHRELKVRAAMDGMSRTICYGKAAV